MEENISKIIDRLSWPATRALHNYGIREVKDLAKYSAKELLKLHGFGKATIPMVNEALAKEGLTLKDD